MKQISSFKEFIDNMKADPYKYIVNQNSDNDENDKDKPKDDEKEKGENLIQYLLYASSASN